MKEKLKKVGKYIKEHKKEIAIGTVVTIGSIFVDKTELIKQLGGFTEHALKLDVGTCDGYSTCTDNWIGTTINDLHVGDLGKVGTELLKIPGITEESTISAIIQNENL